MPAQILIVDDDRELSRMLRATLELFDRSYKIVEVPSAEEAMLEARRSPFDLIIADIRLPGMDGLEMTRRIRKIHPKIQTIIITGGSSPEVEAEAQNLNTDAFIAAVQRALGATNKPLPKPQEIMSYSPSLADRLTTLRRDLGCLAVYLSDNDGRVVARAGDVSAFDVDGLLSHLEVAFSASMKVCGMLGGLVMQNMHFFDGDEYDLYVLNVGQAFMLLMLYTGDIGSRQMGQVSRYGRQCADDMLNALAEMPSPLEPTAIPPTIELTSPELPEPIVLTHSPDLEPIIEPEPAQPAIEIRAEVLDAAAGQLAQADLDSFWDEALTQPATEGATGNALSFEQALKLGLVPKENQS